MPTMSEVTVSRRTRIVGAPAATRRRTAAGSSAIAPLATPRLATSAVANARGYRVQNPSALPRVLAQVHAGNGDPSLLMECNIKELFYGTVKAVRDTKIPLQKNVITALIGPSGSGKSTVLPDERSDPRLPVRTLCQLPREGPASITMSRLDYG
jgi:hypothetical protein